jgi:hypothetical protein
VVAMTDFVSAVGFRCIDCKRYHLPTVRLQLPVCNCSYTCGGHVGYMDDFGPTRIHLTKALVLMSLPNFIFLRHFAQKLLSLWPPLAPPLSISYSLSKRADKSGLLYM